MPDPLIVMLDANLANVLLDDDILRNGIRDLVDHGAAAVYVTHIAIDEILATKDEALRDRLIHALLWIGGCTVPTDGFVLDRSRLDLATPGGEADIAAFTEGNPALINDALIALTADDLQIPLVTAERRRGRHTRHVPHLQVLSVAALRDAVNERLIAEGRLDRVQLPLVQDIQSRVGREPSSDQF